MPTIVTIDRLTDASSNQKRKLIRSLPYVNINEIRKTVDIEGSVEVQN